MKKVMLITGLVLVVCLLVPVSCAKGPPQAEETMPAGVPEREESYKEVGADALPSIEEERMIVRNGEISLVVNDVTDARDEIAQLAVRFDGYVVSSQISGEEQDMRERDRANQGSDAVSRANLINESNFSVSETGSYS